MITGYIYLDAEKYFIQYGTSDNMILVKFLDDGIYMDVTPYFINKSGQLVLQKIN